MQDTVKFLEWKGKEYPLVFNLNVMEKIQDEYKTFKNWTELVENVEEINIKALKFGIKEIINEGLDIEGEKELLTDKQIGRLLTEIGMEKVTQNMQEIIIDSTKTDEESKNA